MLSNVLNQYDTTLQFTMFFFVFYIIYTKMVKTLDLDWLDIKFSFPKYAISDEKFKKLFSEFDTNDDPFREGGQRKVFIATLKKTGIKYAIKTDITEESASEYSGDDSDEECEHEPIDLSLERKLKYHSLYNELSLSRHPNITAASYVSPSYSAEKFRGEDNLTQYIINSTGKPSIVERLRICKRFMKGLHYIHNQGLSHFDLKPDNIFMSENDGRIIPSIGDFGNLASGLHTDRSKIGTPTWAPSAVSSKECQTWDIYSACLIILSVLLWKGNVMVDCQELLRALNKPGITVTQMCKALSMVFEKDKRYGVDQDECFIVDGGMYSVQLKKLTKLLRYGILGEECDYKDTTVKSIAREIGCAIRRINRM